MESYSVLMTRSAAKELEKVPVTGRRRIVETIRALAVNPRPAGCEKLSGDDKFRLRQGDYRILNEIRDAELIVTLVRIGNRKEVYKR